MFSLVAIILLPVGAATITETDLDRTTIDALVARLAPDHPRLGFRPRAEEGVRTIEQVRQTYESTEQFRALYKRTLDVPDTRSSCVVLASKWIVTGRDRYAEKAIALLAKAEIKNTEQSGYY